MINDNKVHVDAKGELVSFSEAYEEFKEARPNRSNHIEWETTCNIARDIIKRTLWVSAYCCAAVIGLLFGGILGAITGIGCVLLGYLLTCPEDEGSY